MAFSASCTASCTIVIGPADQDRVLAASDRGLKAGDVPVEDFAGSGRARQSEAGDGQHSEDTQYHFRESSRGLLHLKPRLDVGERSVGVKHLGVLTKLVVYLLIGAVRSGGASASHPLDDFCFPETPRSYRSRR